MKIVAGSFPTVSAYSISGGMLTGVPLGGSHVLNASTVASVTKVDAGKSYNYAKGGVGMFAGGVLAGPLGLAIGGLLPKVFKDDTVEFVIRFADGRVAHCVGSPREYQAALKAAYRAGGAPVVPGTPAPPAPPKVQESRAEYKARKKRLQAERNAAQKAIRAENPPFKEMYQRTRELDREYFRKLASGPEVL